MLIAGYVTDDEISAGKNWSKLYNILGLLNKLHLINI